MKKVTVLIADDHRLMRDSLGLIIGNNADFEIIGLCGNAEEAIEKTKTFGPDIVIMDINMPGMSGIEAIPHILKYSQHSKIVGMSMHTQPTYARKMMFAGASGYVTKNSSCDELITALKEISNGNKYICRVIRDIIAEEALSEEIRVDKYDQLTSRELDIIARIKNGLTSKLIAEALNISVKTVQVHRYNILKKLGLHNTASLINFIRAKDLAG